MNGSYAGNAGIFLIQTVFGLISLAFMLRLLLQLVRANFFNPVSQFLVKVTNPLLVPLRRIIPGLFGLDMASVVILFGLQALELFLITTISGISLAPAGLVVISIAYLLRLLFNIYFYAILIQVILSWVNPAGHNPVVGLIYQLTEPVMAPARRILPPISGFDLSPILVMIALQLANILIVMPITDLGRTLG